ncbi:hypothetical protein HK100_000573 [Physocladia obscura]|uniref:Peptidase A1 domain-containing protein n=1 Tax=Physocladia obscura TaxID=109957 RepID=A0AAD5T467_9FUNG|nr:hypothetical protein HK100_000573 [Physocladia obscura]
MKEETAQTVRLSARGLTGGTFEAVLEAKVARQTARYAWVSGTEGIEAGRRDANTIAVTNVGGSALYTDVKIGTPGKAFFVDVDTGSSVLWVPSVACVAAGACPAASDTYSITASSTGVVANNSVVFEEDYGTGAVRGYLVRDTVVWGPLTAQQQLVMLVTQMDTTMFDQMSSIGGDGILGLAYDRGQGATVGFQDGDSASLTANLLASNALPNSYFALWFNQSAVFSTANPNDPNGGAVSFGSTDQSLYTGQFTFVPIVPTPILLANGSTDNLSYYWTVPISSSTVATSNGASFSIPTDTQIIVDSGTTLIAVDDTTLSAMIQIIGSVTQLVLQSSLYYFDCNTVQKLPTFNFYLGSGSGTLFPITYNSYVISDGVNCALGLMGLPQGQPSNLWIFGDTFLYQYYTVFDFGNKQVGFALATDGAGSGVPSGTSSSATAGGNGLGTGTATVTVTTTKSSAVHFTVSLALFLILILGN